MIPQDTLLDQLKSQRVSEYASPMLRAVVGAVDLAVLAVLQVIVAGVLAHVVPNSVPASPYDQTTFDMLFSPVAIIVLTLLYFPISWALWGKTLVMRGLGLRVVAADSLSGVDLPHALLRFGALLLSILPFGAGLFAATNDPRHQAWHDRMARTLVIPE